MSGHFTTPSRHKAGERLFKTPMSFSPRVVGNKARPSPSRIELWKQELGLDDTQIDVGGESGSDSDNENTDPNFKANPAGPCSPLEYRALQRELEERNSERDEWLYKIKQLTDRNKQYKQWLEKEETNKKQQLRIMRKTHEAQLQEKLRLVHNLQIICQEQEGQISVLEARIRGESEPSEETATSGISSLVEQLENLQAENAKLTSQVLQQEKDMQGQHQTEEVTLRTTNEKLEKEKQELQEEIYRLQTEKVCIMSANISSVSLY